MVTRGTRTASGWSQLPVKERYCSLCGILASVPTAQLISSSRPPLGDSRPAGCGLTAITGSNDGRDARSHPKSMRSMCGGSMSQDSSMSLKQGRFGLKTFFGRNLFFSYSDNTTTGRIEYLRQLFGFLLSTLFPRPDTHSHGSMDLELGNVRAACMKVYLPAAVLAAKSL